MTSIEECKTSYLVLYMRMLRHVHHRLRANTVRVYSSEDEDMYSVGIGYSHNSQHISQVTVMGDKKIAETTLLVLFGADLSLSFLD